MDFVFWGDLLCTYLQVIQLINVMSNLELDSGTEKKNQQERHYFDH